MLRCVEDHGLNLNFVEVHGSPQVGEGYKNREESPTIFVGHPVKNI